MRIRRRVGRGRIVLLVFLALCITLITLDFRSDEDGVIEGAKDVTAAVVQPIQRGFTAIFRPVGNFFSSIGELAALRSDNKRLEEELKELQAETANAEAALDENERLRDLLELDAPWAAMSRVAAEVVAKEPQNFSWIFRINVGSNDGVKEKMTVVNWEGLVGRILDVHEDYSTVLLLIDPNGSAGAKLVNKGASGNVAGRGAGEPLSMDFVEIDAPVTLGDAVETSYIGGTIFPPNIPIGLVTRVEGDSAASHQTIEVQPYVDFTKLDFVYVLLDTPLTADESN